MRWVVVDCETDGFVFEYTKMWTVVLRDADSSLKVNPFIDNNARQDVLDFIFKGDDPHIAFHNGLGFDIFAMKDLLGMDFDVGKRGSDWLCGMKCQFVDTFYLSMFLNPDRDGHSIDHFGSVLGIPKIDWREEATGLGLIDKAAPSGAEFKQHHPQMDVYCERDVDVNWKVLEYLLAEWEDVYGVPFTATQAFKCGQKSFFLMSCQELTGWKFDIDAGIALKEKISGMMEEIRVIVEPQLPARSLKKGEEKEYTMPAKPFKKNGDLSEAWWKFARKHSGELNIGSGLWNFYGKEYPIIAGTVLDVTLPMEMGNQDQMKEYFISQGWRPTLWNYKKGPDGKPVRDPKTRQLVKSSPKIQEAGKICPNLFELDGDVVSKVVKWLSLRNRQSVLGGWLTNPRMAMDGRIGAGRTGIAATHRQKHKVVVNVPKASDKVLLGHEFRSLWTSEEGMQIAAGDAAALEGRVQGHYCWRYDGGATAHELLAGDPHSKNASVYYSHIPEVARFDVTAEWFNKDDPAFKPYRDRAKNG